MITGNFMNTCWLRLSYLCTLLFSVNLLADNSADTLIFRSALDTPAAQYSQALLTQAYNDLGIKAKFISVPFGRSLVESNKGNLSGELARILDVTKAYPNLRAVPYVLFDSEVNLYINNTKCAECSLNTVSSLVYIRGAVILENLISTLPADIQLIPVADTAAARQLYEQQRVDAALFVAYRITPLTNKFVSKQQTLKTVPDYHMLHKGYEPLLQPLAKALFKLEANGTAEKLRRQFKVPAPNRQLDSHLSPVVAEFN